MKFDVVKTALKVRSKEITLEEAKKGIHHSQKKQLDRVLEGYENRDEAQKEMVEEFSKKSEEEQFKELQALLK